MTPKFEFQPFRNGLYSADELLGTFDPKNPKSYAETVDVKIYHEFVANGGAATTDYLTAMSRSLHDNAISQCLADRINTLPVVAIMGGHSSQRKSNNGSPNPDTSYKDAAYLASSLTAKGFTIVTGGGPGAMEAAHLGAAFAGDSGLKDALAELESEIPAIPVDASNLVIGSTIDLAIAEKIGLYLAPAIRIRKQLPKGGGIGVPTWMYGYEPTTPLAADIAKYFQNSIREDGMLALATHGIIYVQGGPGTMQEVFQDAAQNFYHTFPVGGAGYFSPMVFFGQFWKSTMNVSDTLEAIFGPLSTPQKKNVHRDEYEAFVKFTSDYGEAVDFISNFKPPKPNHVLAQFRHQKK